MTPGAAGPGSALAAVEVGDEGAARRTDPESDRHATLSCSLRPRLIDDVEEDSRTRLGRCLGHDPKHERGPSGCPEGPHPRVPSRVPDTARPRPGSGQCATENEQPVPGIATAITTAVSAPSGPIAVIVACPVNGAELARRSPSVVTVVYGPPCT